MIAHLQLLSDICRMKYLIISFEEKNRKFSADRKSDLNRRQLPKINRYKSNGYNFSVTGFANGGCHFK